MTKIIAKDGKQRFTLYTANAETPEKAVQEFLLSYGLCDVPSEVSGSLINRCFVETPNGLKKIDQFIDDEK